MKAKLTAKVRGFKVDTYRIINKALYDAVGAAVYRYLDHREGDKVELLRDGINDNFNDKLVDAFWLNLEEAGLTLEDAHEETP